MRVACDYFRLRYGIRPAERSEEELQAFKKKKRERVVCVCVCDRENREIYRNAKISRSMTTRRRTYVVGIRRHYSHELLI
jgi:hypothetical protein